MYVQKEKKKYNHFFVKYKSCLLTIKHGDDSPLMRVATNTKVKIEYFQSFSKDFYHLNLLIKSSPYNILHQLPYIKIHPHEKTLII